MEIILKSAEQVEGIRKSCQLAARCLNVVEEHVQPGVTTDSLNRIIDEFIRDNGAIPAPLDYHGFPKETCISLNEVVCHGIPGDEVLKEGDILNIDVTTILDGYFGDTSRMYSVGEISDEADRLLKIAKECLDIGIEQVAPGNPIGQIGYAITQLANACECGTVYQFVGHGVGLQFHEPPQVPHYVPDLLFEDVESVVMQPGMIFTIEPMINLGTADAIISKKDGWTARTADGSLSAQYEHTVLVTDDGVEILTKLEEE